VLFPRGLKLEEVTSGDQLVYYAVGGPKAVFGIVRLAEDPIVDKYVGSSDPAQARWPSAAACTSSRAEQVDALWLAPKLEDVSPRLASVSLHMKSHLEMTDAEFLRARTLIRKASALARGPSGMNPP
jgi:hypothetical protein